MFRKQKFLFSLLVLVSIATILFVCVGAANKKSEFRLWLFEYDAKMMPDYQALVDEYTKQNPNVKVKLEIPSFSEYYEMLITRLQAGDAPELITLSDIWIKTVDQYLDDWNKYLPKEFGARFYKSPWNYLNVDGKQYGIPQAISTRGLIYRPDIFKELNLKPPVTWDDFYKVCKVIKEKRPDISPWGLQGGNADTDLVNAQFYQFMASCGGKITEDNGDVLIGKSPFREKNVEALAFIKKMVDEDLTIPDPVAYNFVGIMDLYTTGRVAMILNGPWMEFMAKDAGVPYASAPGPMKTNMAAVGFVDCFALNKKAKNKDEIIKFVKWLYDDARRTKWSTEHGMIPCLKAEGKSPFYQTDNWKMFIGQLDFAFYHPIVANWMKISMEGIKHLQSCILGEITPEQAIDDWAAASKAF
jgi:multiple sugar transport system substrate-binding protein